MSDSSAWSGTEPSFDAETEPSFDAVFCSLLPRLYRRAALLTGTPHTAEDIVHDAYLKLAARPERLLAHPDPYAYAVATVVSVVRDGWRRDRKQILMAELDVDQRAGDRPANGPAGKEGQVENRVSELEAVRLLRQLTRRQAAVVVLVDLDGYTIDQAAAILSVHRGTASRARARALDKLRHLLTVAPPVPGLTPVRWERHET